MTMRLDVVTHDAGELVRREHARDLGAGVVVAVYRLARLAQMHDPTNQAFVRQLEETHALVRDYCLRAGGDVSILFARRAVFVAGQLLKGSRATYESAAELGDILEWCGGAELSIARDVTVEELRQFADAVSTCMRGERGRGLRMTTSRIRLRPVAEAARLRGIELEHLGEEERTVRAYASAVVIMRRFFDDMREGRYVMPRRLKRIAQTLVDLSAGATPAFLGVTEARNANHDEAGRAVNAAILAVAIVREMTRERSLLVQVATAAMVHDAGRPRAAQIAAAGGDAPRLTQVAAKLPEEAEETLPAGTAAVLTALGRVNEPTITRSVVAYEALWLRRARALGPVYSGVRGPTLQAKAVALARRYCELMTPEPGLPAPAPDFAIATLAGECAEPIDRSVLRMLVAALGLFPVGTVVQLSTGEVAEVVGGSDERASLDKPRVRLVMDARGAVLEKMVEIDLARNRPPEPPRAIAKVLSVDGWKKGLEARPREDAAPPVEVPPPSSRRDPPEPGTSPSSVASALDPFMSVPPPAPAPPARGDRTVMQPQPPAFDEAGRGRVAFSIPPGARKGAGTPLKELPPTAKGSLGATPLVHVLVYMLDHALSGTVVFREPDGAESLVYFLEGTPAKVKTHRPVAFLGDELVKLGAVSQEAIVKALESTKRLGVLLGEYLVGNGLLQQSVLSRALAVQLKKKVASLANLPPETDYLFYRDVNGLDAWAGEQFTPVHPLDALLATVRGWYDRARIHATLSRIASQKLALHPEVDLAPVELNDDEESTLAVIRADRPTFGELLQRRVADEEGIGSLVYTLAVTRQFQFPSQKGPPMARKVAVASAAAAAAPLPFSAVVEPGGAKGASPPIPASTWRPPPDHPATNPPKTMQDESPHVEVDVDVEVVVENDHPAQEVGAAAGDDEGWVEANAERALQAMTDFRLAETALARGDSSTAERLAARAVESDPQPDYVALLAWLRAMSNSPSAVTESITRLGQLLDDEPRAERALLYRGQLYKRAGRLKEALRDFQRVLEVNPGHREAASEARVLKGRIG